MKSIGGGEGRWSTKRTRPMEVDLRCALSKARDHDENLIEFSMCSRRDQCFSAKSRNLRPVTHWGAIILENLEIWETPGDSSKRLFE